MGYELQRQVVGSPGYLPPEQAEAKRGKVSRQSDVYGLGAILYQLVTARPAFQAETLPDVLHQVVSTLPREVGWFPRIGFSPDGNTLFAGSLEGTAPPKSQLRASLSSRRDD